MTVKKKKYAMLGLIVGLILLGGLLADIFFVKIVRINEQTFIATTPLSVAAYQKGLGGKKDLCRTCAMLFHFYRVGRYAFWMKDMQFDLDIIWIRDGQIVYIKNDFSSNSTAIVEPVAPADNVLEIGAGLAEKYGFKVGDRVAIY